MASGVSEANEAQRQRLGVHGQCPGRDSEPDKVIFVPGGSFFFLCVCRAEIVSGGRPRLAPPTIATTLHEFNNVLKLILLGKDIKARILDG